jgi:hypothetical protein
MFPPLPSASNPYAAEAAGFASSAHAILNSLKAAHYQQQELQARQAQQAITQQHQDETERREAFNQGWVPAETQTPDPSGLIRRDSVPGQDPSRIETFGGRRFYKPTDVEAGKAYVPPEGSLMYNLHIANGWDGKTPVTAQQSHQLAMAVNEAESRLHEPFDIDTSGKFTGPDGKPVPVAIGRKTGKVTLLDLGGGNAAPAQDPEFDEHKGGAMPATAGMPGGPFAAAVPAQPAQPATQMSGGMPGGPFTAGAPAQPGAAPQIGFAVKPPAAKERKETPDDWIRMITDPATDPAEKKRAQAALDLARAPGTESDKDRDLTRQSLQADRAERRSEREETKTEGEKKTFRGIEATKQKAISDATKAYRKKLDTALTPEDKQSALDDFRSDLDEAQRAYENAGDIETGNRTPHDPWAQTYDPNAKKGGAKDPLGVRAKGKADPLGIR